VTTKAPAVSVIVPVLNEEQRIAGLLDSLGRQTEGDFEVLVVDNGSADGTVPAAAAHPLGARVLSEPAPGPYAARNAGIVSARAEVLAFTDADCRPEPGWLEAGLLALDAGADLVAGAILQTAGDPETVWERYDRAMYLRQQDYVAEGFGATANLFSRAEVFRVTGPFVAELTASGDVEFGRRALSADFRLVYQPTAVVRHRARCGPGEIWALHRKLGTGFAQLARRGLRPPAWRDPALRQPIGMVVDAVAADGPPLRRRQLLAVHTVAMAGRWAGAVLPG